MAPTCFFFAGPFPGAGLALEEVVMVAGACLAGSSPEMVALVSEDVPLEILTPPACSSELPSELSSDELDELDELESEEDSGSGVLVAFFRAFESAFLEVSFSDSEESESDPELLSELELELELELALEAELELLALLELEESESESESEPEPDSEESELEESELEESELEEFELEEDLEDFSTFLAFLALGASLSELESEEDSLLDSALRFKLAGFLVTGAGAAGASSSSSSASLSELDEAEDEDEEEEEEEEGEEARLDFSSCISTSESLSLSLSLEEDIFLLEALSQLWNNSCREGAFFASDDLPAFFNSFSKAVLELEKPLSERNVATAESS